jgi:hypothetical protein
MSVRFGILSTAKINEQVLAGARDSELVEVAAVASDQARAEEYAREHGIARAYGGYEKLLADPELDAVYISLPNSLLAGEPSTPIGWSWRISPTRSGARASCCSAGKTRSVKPARSRRSTARPRRARP